jgi:hypothetical protein
VNDRVMKKPGRLCSFDCFEPREMAPFVSGLQES